MQSNGRPYVVDAGEGEGIWFLNTLFTVKAGADQTDGAFTWMEQLCPPGFAPPFHVHYSETEAFFMIDGAMTVFCDGIERDVGRGDFVLLPARIPHGFRVAESGPARFVHMTAPGRFDDMARELGQPASSLVLPEPSEPNVERLLAVMERYDLGIFPDATGPAADQPTVKGDA